MPEIILMGWDDTNKIPVRCKVTADGKLIINPTGFLENPPTEDEDKKAPTSEWAFDHDADPAAHHVKYTDADSRGALNNLFNLYGTCLRNLNLAGYTIINVLDFQMIDQQGGAGRFGGYYRSTTQERRMWAKNNSGVFQDCVLKMYDGSTYRIFIRDDTFQAALALYLEGTPTNGVVNKGPTSNWAFDHDADAGAHHAKYTDAEAVASFYAQQTTITTGTYTNESMTGVNSIFLNTTGGDITLKGLADGTIGQMIFCYRNTSSNNVHVIHASGDAQSSDKIYCVTGANESIVANHYGSFWLVYTGSFWMIDHTLI